MYIYSVDLYPGHLLSSPLMKAETVHTPRTYGPVINDVLGAAAAADIAVMMLMMCQSVVQFVLINFCLCVRVR